MRWLRYSIISALVALLVEVIGLVWALNRYRFLDFGDDRLEYWLDRIVILFIFLAIQTAVGLLLQVVTYRRLEAAK